MLEEEAESLRELEKAKRKDSKNDLELPQENETTKPSFFQQNLAFSNKLAEKVDEDSKSNFMEYLAKSKFDHKQEIEEGKPVFHIDQKGNRYTFRVFIYCYTVGKEEICLELAKYYKTKIVVDKDRYRMIQSLNYYREYFTNDSSEGFIHLSKGIHTASKTSKDDSIHIVLTGWINCKSYLCLKKGQYQVAYSSHSNYEELDQFVSIVRPGVLNPVVIERQEDTDISDENIKSMAGYYFWLQNLKKRGMDLLSELTRKPLCRQKSTECGVPQLFRPRKAERDL